MQARLDSQDGEWGVARYQGNPKHGGSQTGEVSKTIGAQAERITAGAASGAIRRETASVSATLYYYTSSVLDNLPLQSRWFIMSLTAL